VAGLFAEQGELIEPRDVLIAISAHPYAPETLAVAEAAARRHVPIIAVTDTPVSPLARLATLCLIVRETELRGLRSLTASLCLAQTLVVALALRRTGERSLAAAQDS
jgi:DNA-binding MurR/RpiR family transcriptional regulator